MPTASREHNLLSMELRSSAPEWSRFYDQPQKRSPIWVRCSEIDNCLRAVYYSILGTPIDNPWGMTTREKLEKGNLIQDRIRGFLIPNWTSWWVNCWKPEVELATAISPALVLRGHPDGILQKKNEPSRKALLEVKSTSRFGYDSTRKACFSDPEHYSYGYFKQANRYFHLWNLTFPDDPVEEICIFLYNINGDGDPVTDTPCRDYWFRPDPAEYKKDLKRAISLEGYIRHEQAPEKEYSLEHWRCQGCLWKHTCWEIPRSPADSGGSAATGASPQNGSKVAKRTVSRRPRTTKK